MQKQAKEKSFLIIRLSPQIFLIFAWWIIEKKIFWYHQSNVKLYRRFD